MLLITARHGTVWAVEIEVVILNMIHQMMNLTKKMIMAKNKLALAVVVESVKYRQRCVDFSANEFSKSNIALRIVSIENSDEL